VFVTSPVFELHVPRGLGQPGQRFWRSVGFSLNVPWFIVSVSYDDEDENASVVQEMLMASDADLQEILGGDAADSVVGVQFVEPPAFSKTGTWRMRSVKKIWRAAKQSGSPGSALVFEDEHGRFAGPLDDADLRRVKDLLCEFADRR
jgi:hypothetical protein